MVMEYVPGGSLIQYMRTEYPGKSMPEREAWRLFLPLFRGLEHIHQLKVVHRDIKLDNILLDKSASILKFTDVRFTLYFSLSQLPRESLAHTHTHQRLPVWIFDKTKRSGTRSIAYVLRYTSLHGT